MHERRVYDSDTGRLLTDCCPPLAGDLPSIEIAYKLVPRPLLGVKVVRQAGAIGSPTALVTAVIDAPALLATEPLEMPLTPERLWQAFRAADARRPA